VFVTNDGTVLRTDAFLGPPRAVGHIPCPAWPGEFHLATGLLAVVSDGALWTTAGDAPVRHRFHDRVRSAAFGSAARGAAVLEHGDVVATADGGETWATVDLQREVASMVVSTPQGLAVDTTAGAQLLAPGGPRHVDLDLLSFIVRDPTFDDPGGRVARAASLTSEAFAVEPGADRCPGEPPEFNQTIAPAFASSPGLTGFVCRYTEHGPPPEAPPDARNPAGTPAGWGLGMNTVTNAGVVDTGLWHEPDGRTRLLVEWAGRDAAGPFTGRAGPETANLPALHWPTSERPMGVPWLVLGVSRGGVLLNAIAFNTAEAGCPLLWADHEGSITMVGQSTGCFGLAGGYASRSTALPDGGVALVQSFHEDRRTLVGALDVGPDGVVRQHRGLVAERDEQVALGRWRGSLGIVTGRPGGDRAWWFHPMQGGLPWALPPMPAATLHACVTAPTPDTPETLRVWFTTLDLVFLAGPPDAAGSRSTFGWGLRYEVEWNADELCLRSVVLDRGIGDRGDAMTLEARPGDRLEGTVHDAGTDRVGCAPGHAPHRQVRGRILNSFCGMP
jgi:hypothetical protein